MIVLGADIGGATRNGITVMNENFDLVYHMNVPFDKKQSKGCHRRKVARLIQGLVTLYKVDLILVERVKQFKGDKHSKMGNVESLVRIVCAIIDNCCEFCEIFDVQVGSWKSQVFGFNTKDKQVSIDYVFNKYGIDMVHDEADSVGIATYGVMNFDELMDLATGKTDKMVGSVCLTHK